jgi:hypothetical protein
MNARPSRRDTAMPSRKLASAMLVFVLGTLLAGCAPDEVRDTNLTTFNAYIRKIGTACGPLRIGTKEIGEMIRLSDAGNDTDYAYFLDVTSKLYYNRISPAAYRESVAGAFGPGAGNDAGLDCILNNLPAQRPNAPQ